MKIIIQTAALISIFLISGLNLFARHEWLNLPGNEISDGFERNLVAEDWVCITEKVQPTTASILESNDFVRVTESNMANLGLSDVVDEVSFEKKLVYLIRGLSCENYDGVWNFVLGNNWLQVGFSFLGGISPDSKYNKEYFIVLLPHEIKVLYVTTSGVE